MRLNRSLLLVCLLGFAVRLGFILAGANIYFGRENIFVDSDTGAWAGSIESLIETGTYTLNSSSEYGYFNRMPGYSFFLGLFYLLLGRDWNAVYPVVGWLQTLLDVFAIVLVYRIGMRLFGSGRMATASALLYALYPFVIVWTPVAYSESISVLLLIAALYFLTHPEYRFYYGWSAALLGLGALFRPQLLLLIPVVGLYLLFRYHRNIPLLLSRAALFGAMVLLTYGWWPARNYMNHGKLILTQDLRGIRNWNVDVLAYMQYVYSVKAEWEPQFSQILRNEKVEMPKEAYATREDSVLLERTLALAKTCGSGFSYWRGYWQEPFDTPNCNAEIQRSFEQLRANAIRNNPSHFYVTLPLQNLKKAVFKTKLYDTSTPARKAASLLFLYRTVMILIGLAGCLLMIVQRHRAAWFCWICLGYFVFLYLTLCAGTSPQQRNIEMRYFLHPDLLLLLPGAWLIVRVWERLTAKTQIAKV